ncbi:acyltransferase family protein [Planococcus sp. FY231025]|uniref:acyltransferase family protein n=1 Tax=Planococcus sp. FY231025 TaxID=3455699 RepID=UPI003F921AEA
MVVRFNIRHDVFERVFFYSFIIPFQVLIVHGDHHKGFSFSVLSNSKKDKIWFAQMLRGVACLIIVYFHYFDLFWSKHDRLIELANVNQTSFSSNLFILDISSFLEGLNINLGAVGVSLFFIISGFVIPFSLANSGKIEFLIKRFFRVLPPYAVGLILTTLTVLIYSRVNNLKFPYTVVDFIANLSLLRDWTGLLTIDGINWTLEMEFKFYFLIAILSIFFGIRSSKALIISSSLLFTSSLLFSFTSDSINVYITQILSVLSNSAIYLTFMMIGICYYNYFKSN